MDNKETTFEQNLKELSLRAHFSLMSCKDKWGQYLCLHSNDHTFKTAQTYSIYQFPALLRVLGRKADLFTSTLQQELYNTDDTLVAILNWQGMKREFIYLKFSKTDEDFIIQFLKANKSNLINHIKKIKDQLSKGDLNCP